MYWCHIDATESQRLMKLNNTTFHWVELDTIDKSTKTVIFACMYTLQAN